MANENNSDKAKDKQNGSLFIPAGVLLGVGVGFLIDNIPAGTLVGLGLGFLMFAAITAFRK